MFYLFLESKVLLGFLFNFPTGMNYGLAWNMGFLLVFLTIMQTFTGVLLSFVINMGKNCLESKHFVFKELPFGWVLMNLHSITPNFMFLFLYVHMLKNFLFPVYSMLYFWISGVMMFMGYMLITFTGYSLVFGAMSYFALMVSSEIIKFMMGESLSEVLLFTNGIGVLDSTLYKMFTYHYTLSFMVILMMGSHMNYLHAFGSSNGSFFSYVDKYSFSSILLVKDLYVMGGFLVIFFNYMFFNPESVTSGDVNMGLGKMDSIEMNVEWYLSIFFMVLSAMESKFFGILFMGVLLLVMTFMVVLKNLWGMNEGSNNFILVLANVLVVMVVISSNSFSTSLLIIPIYMLICFNVIFEQVLANSANSVLFYKV